MFFRKRHLNIFPKSAVDQADEMNNSPHHLIASSPHLSHIFSVWFKLGIQSFGGGVATLTLIQRAAVDNEKWVSDLEFANYWAICQVAPGINLFALTILLGRKSGGALGILAALAGLLLPSITITILMTAGYAHIRSAPATLAALRGVLPATIGLGLVTTIQIVRPLATAARKEGVDTVIVSLVALVGSGAVIAVWHLPVIFALIGSSVLCAVHAWLRSLRSAT
jgi:chromate transporter